ncbi:MAG: methyl-accepting chemotaxis protein [Nitrospirota bacterium]
MNLQKRSISMVAAILFVIIVINTTVLTFIAYNKYKQAILSKSTSIGESLQRELEKVLLLGVPLESLEGMSEKLADLVSRNKALGYAMVMDTKGRILFHNEQNNIGKELKDKESMDAASSNKVLIQTVDTFYDLSFPLLNAEEKIIGALRIGVESKVINAQLYELLLWALGISILCFLLSLLLVYFLISRFITKPIIAMENAANRIASGDLTCVINVRGKDEVASLENAINRMAFNLKDMFSKVSNITNSVSNVTSNIASSSQEVLSVSDIQRKAIEGAVSSTEEMNNSISKIAGSTENLSASASETFSSIFEMSTSIEKIAENANIFNDTAQETASSIEEMVTTIKQIAESLGNLSTSSEEISSSINEVNSTTIDIESRATESVVLAETVMSNASEKGMSAARIAMEGMENIKNSVMALSDVINMLGKRTDDIGKILNVIDDVTDQTNLLAINAAILASKAGEHGKGFSVVADEIKSLAERTSFSTNEIAELIKSVQDVTRSSIKMASDGIKTVEKGLLHVQDLNDTLSEIVESSKASTDMVKAIQRATSEESIVIKHITLAVETMTEQIENISRAIQEQNRGSRFIIEATEKVKDLSRQVKIATSEQKDGSKRIANVLENVTNQASQIADATKKQKENSSEIVNSVKKIRNSTEQLIRSSNNMNAVISALKEESQTLIQELKKFKV